MFSTSRKMLTTLIACTAIAACTNDDPLSPVRRPDGANVRLVANVADEPVQASTPDSTLDIGDTVRVSAVAVNLRGNKARNLKWTYSSSDTSVAVVDRSGLVRARANGLVSIVARTSVGSATVPVTIGTPTPSDPPTPEPMPPAPAPPATEPPASGPTVPDSEPTIVVPETPGAGSIPPYAVPIRPADVVDVRMPAVTGRTIRVAANDGGALQTALNSAVGGDEVVLPNGSEYLGNFTLPRHAGAGVVIVRSENVSTPFGTRLVPGAATTLARIFTGNVAPAIATAEGASGWRLVGLSIGLRSGAVDNYGIVTLGTGSETAHTQFVSNIVLDRVMISAGDNQTSRCVGFNGNALAVVHSWLADCHAKGRDAQGIGGWSGVGPFLIEDNHIEGSGQNIMFGGSDPKVVNVVPSDITIRGNHLFKPLTWGAGRWTVKAAFELKNARRVLFEGNVIENHWIDAQVGYAVLFQAVNQDGSAPWSGLKDITVQHNIIKNSTSGFNLLSRLTFNGTSVNEPTVRVLLRNNLFVNVGRDPISGQAGRYVQMASDHEDVTLVQNTFYGASGANNAVMLDGAPSRRTMFFNNLFGRSEYGIFGSNYGEGTSAVNHYLPGAIVSGNAITGRSGNYPAGNTFPASVETTDFVNAAGGDYTLRNTLSYSAHGGTIVGVNGQAILAAVQGAAAR
ncbi:MAG TPA: Ig-like domain-containing protein [Gemmatimonadaceae bacterium]|nr:Ig-like domain-containing protein [Gemmatimonadaceae bacterium]